MSTGQSPLSFTTNFAAIIAANPGLQLTADRQRMIGDGRLLIIPKPKPLPIVAVPKGCIELLRFGDGDEDLDIIKIDGQTYRAENLKEFKETFMKAACCGICINFCIQLAEPNEQRPEWNPMNRIFMVNLYPCSECVPNETCGCDHGPID